MLVRAFTLLGSQDAEASDPGVEVGPSVAVVAAPAGAPLPLAPLVPLVPLARLLAFFGSAQFAGAVGAPRRLDPAPIARSLLRARDSSGPSDPSDPLNPSDPLDPSDPSEPSDPSNPSDLSGRAATLENVCAWLSPRRPLSVLRAALLQAVQGNFEVGSGLGRAGGPSR